MTMSDLIRSSKKLTIREIVGFWALELKLPSSFVLRSLTDYFTKKRIPTYDPDHHIFSLLGPVSDDALVSKKELEQFCDEENYPEPHFWSRRGSIIKAEHDCERWMRQLVGDGYVPWARKDLRQEAREKFGQNLSTTAFNRCWSKCAPEEWKRPGRRPKHKKQSPGFN